MHHRHRILDGDRLNPRRLKVALRSAQRGQQIVMLRQQQVRAVQFGCHMHLHIQLLHRRKRPLRLRHRHGQIAAHAD